MAKKKTKTEEARDFRACGYTTIDVLEIGGITIESVADLDTPEEPMIYVKFNDLNGPHVSARFATDPFSLIQIAKRFAEVADKSKKEQKKYWDEKEKAATR